MAEWVNLFDLGECTVEVYDLAADESVFSQVMTFGDSEAVDDNHAISVGDDGLVTLDGADGESLASYEVRVIPSYAHDFPARIRSIAVGENADEGGGSINADGGLDLDTLDPVYPDPLDLTALEGTRSYVGFYFSNGEIG